MVVDAEDKERLAAAVVAATKAAASRVASEAPVAVTEGLMGTGHGTHTQGSELRYP